MEDYPNNSNASKGEEKKTPVKRVQLSAPAQVKKKSGIRKLGDQFLSEDRGSVKEHLIQDVAIPGIRRILSDGLKDAIDIIFDGRVSDRRRDRGPSWVSYRDDYTRYSRSSSRDDSYVRRSAYDFDDITFRTRADAENVLLELDDRLRQYKVVTVYDFFDICGVTPPYTSQRYGWSDLRTADPVRVLDGWVIRLPKPIALDP